MSTDHTNNSVVLITGASRGIGRALANQFAMHGRDLFLVSRHLDQLDALKTELETRFDISVNVAAIDLSHPNAWQDVASCVAAAGCHIETLVNNAGLGLAGSLTSSAPPQTLPLIDVNVRLTTALISHFAL